jgi:serine phosphatase RsbU (regulator of sigma subunit)
MRPSLRAFLFAALAITTIAPIAYFGLTQSAHWQEVQRQEADMELRFTAEGLARTLGESLRRDVRDLESLANAVRLLDLADTAGLQSLLRQYCSTTKACLGVSRSALDGIPVLAEPLLSAPATVYDRGYFQELLRNQRTAVSGIELGRITGLPTIHLASPVWAFPPTSPPTLTGAVVTAHGLDYLQVLTAKSVEVFGDMHAQVLDGRRRVILDSTPAGAPPLADLSDNPLYRAISKTGRATLRDGQGRWGVPVRAALAHVSELGLDWTVAVMRQTQWIEQHANRARLSTFIAIAAALVLGLFFAYALSSWLAHPISKLARYADHVAKEDSVPRPQHGRFEAREVSDLLEHVFSMVSRLQEQANALRDREKEQILLAQVRQELNIAERIQSGILPKRLALPGFESAARMKPAEAVGGDYYEILPTPTGFWIAAGDVSGHGLNAGLVMLMLQSALGALAIYAPGARPADLLKAANRLLVENIRRRLGGDDHATLVLMHVDLDGRFVFAGGHEPLLLWRKRTGQCEIIDTPGPWMGILPDIGKDLSEGQGQLEPGDLLLFHSDGISESGARQHRPFGLSRLCSVVERLGDEPVDHICREILREAEAWSTGAQEDDMTIVAIRRAAEAATPARLAH